MLKKWQQINSSFKLYISDSVDSLPQYFVLLFNLFCCEGAVPVTTLVLLFVLLLFHEMLSFMFYVIDPRLRLPTSFLVLKLIIMKIYNNNNEEVIHFTAKCLFELFITRGFPALDATGFLIVNFEHMLHFPLVFLLLTLGS